MRGTGHAEWRRPRPRTALVPSPAPRLPGCSPAEASRSLTCSTRRGSSWRKGRSRLHRVRQPDDFGLLRCTYCGASGAFDATLPFVKQTSAFTTAPSAPIGSRNGRCEATDMRARSRHDACCIGSSVAGRCRMTAARSRHDNPRVAGCAASSGTRADEPGRPPHQHIPLALARDTQGGQEQQRLLTPERSHEIARLYGEAVGSWARYQELLRLTVPPQRAVASDPRREPRLDAEEYGH
jgi:hypothetical protein